MAFRADTWSLTRKRKSDKGVCCRLRRVRDGVQLWIGGFYFSLKKAMLMKYTILVQSLPATMLPVIVGGDANAEIKWGEGRSGDVQPYSPEQKGEYMFGVLRERGLEFTPPPSSQREPYPPVDQEKQMPQADRSTEWQPKGFASPRPTSSGTRTCLWVRIMMQRYTGWRSHVTWGHETTFDLEQRAEE